MGAEPLCGQVRVAQSMDGRLKSPTSRRWVKDGLVSEVRKLVKVASSSTDVEGGRYTAPMRRESFPRSRRESHKESICKRLGGDMDATVMGILLDTKTHTPPAWVLLESERKSW